MEFNTMQISKPKIIISGINMVEGGIYTILDNCLQQIERYNEAKKYEIIALVHDKSKFDYPSITFYEFPKSKKYWIYRIYYEYYYFKKLSEKWQPLIWFSLHDITPNVVCEHQFVYCHNPNMFYKPSAKEWVLDYKMGVFGIFYKYLYQINLQKNTNVFVQQHWIKEIFEKKFSISKITVSKPEFSEELTNSKINLKPKKIHFFYPSIPRFYKNYEIIFDATKLLSAEILEKIEIHFTNIKESKTKYGKEICSQYKSNKEYVFLKSLNRSELLTYYNSIDCLIFPSKLETWGLPISEAKAFQKTILVANLPYAKETVGNYEKVSFFDVDRPQELADLITNFVNKEIVFDGNKYHYSDKNQCNNWFEVFDVITKNSSR